MISVRRAGQLDTRQMADLLNAIIAEGGTTAMTKPVTRDALWTRIQAQPDHSAWHVAETDTGAILGFQWIAPNATLPPEAVDIATFVQIGKTGLGIGSKLFEATKAAAIAIGYTWINANIRADNASGLAYYQSRGFEDWKSQPDVQLANGQTVTKLWKRYNL
ncbi:MAG: GNAT family N-acetyltransferase [Paracoccaceae bacterium]|nr:GNAT family N-acetyltransferase [Paracoccaceae bacterium]